MCWFSRTQKCVTPSTAEAEYVAMVDTIKEVIFMRYAWSFVFPGFGLPSIRIFEDNKGAIQLAKNPVCTSNSRHLDVRHHFLR